MLRQYRPVDHGSVAGEGDQQIDIGCEEQSRLGGQNIAGKIAEWRTNNLDAVSLACGEQGDVGTPVGAGEPFAARCDNRTATMGIDHVYRPDRKSTRLNSSPSCASR